MTLQHGIFQLTYCQNLRMLDYYLSFTAPVLIKARYYEVWDTLVIRAKIKEYFFGTYTLTYREVGNSIIFHGEFDGHPYRDKGVVMQVIPEKSLQYKYWSAWSGLEDLDENYQMAAFSIERLDDGIQLTLTQGGFADREKPGETSQMRPGIMEKIKSITERG